MASLTSLKELATCGICFELFNEENRCPRMLPCGHTFCHSCLEKILVQSPSCPTCKAEIQPHQADIIPVNYVVKSLICVASLNNNPSKAQKTKKKKKNTSNSVTSKIDSEGFCTEHSNDKQLRCMDCQSWICGTCCALNHKQCRTLLVKDAYKELKGKLSDNVEKELESRKSLIGNMEQSLTYLEEQRNKLIEEIRKSEIKLKECNMKISSLNSLKLESREFSEHLRQVQTDVKTSINDTEISKILNKFEDLVVEGKNWLTQLENLKLAPIFPTTLEDLRKLSKEKKEVYVVESEKEPLYGKVTFKGEQLRISSFSPIKPEGLLFPFIEFLQRFNGSTDLPNMVYMKFDEIIISPEKVEFDVVIRTDGTSPVIKNFVLLCSGLKGQTYKGMELSRTKDGLISEYDANGTKSKFIIKVSNAHELFKRLDDDIGSISISGHKIGVVVSGLEETRQLYHRFKHTYIPDCGLVIQTHH